MMGEGSIPCPCAGVKFGALPQEGPLTRKAGCDADSDRMRWNEKPAKPQAMRVSVDSLAETQSAPG